MAQGRNRVIVYGAGGHGKVVLDILERDDRVQIAGLVDDDPSRAGGELFGYRILGTGEALKRIRMSGVVGAIVAIGDNETRGRLANRVEAFGLELITALHPAAQIARGVKIGAGSVVMAGVVINAESVLGRNAIVNTGATVDHDCHLGECVHLAPGVHLAGGVRIGQHAHVGMGTVILQGLSVGHHVKVGAGSVVLCDLPPNVTAVGVPARVLTEARRRSCLS
jgi:sugar O-acyltransferase (sialic acid O-acetyltransferase NeuD family)